jgi:hypothetical protein
MPWSQTKEDQSEFGPIAGTQATLPTFHELDHGRLRGDSPQVRLPSRAPPCRTYPDRPALVVNMSSTSPYTCDWLYCITRG